MIRASEPPMNERRSLSRSVHKVDFMISFSVQNSLPSIGEVCGTNSDIWHIMSQHPREPLTSPQIRAARALIRWSAEDLSRHSSVSLRTIRRAELAEWQTSMTAANDLAVRHALESAGVEFIDENAGGPGVRLPKRSGAKSRK
jgi:hypothetical protein